LAREAQRRAGLRSLRSDQGKQDDNRELGGMRASLRFLRGPRSGQAGGQADRRLRQGDQRRDRVIGASRFVVKSGFQKGADRI